MDDVELADSSDQRNGITLAGPQCGELTHQIGLPAISHRPLAHGDRSPGEVARLLRCTPIVRWLRGLKSWADAANYLHACTRS